MTITTEELRKLLSEATPGPWRVSTVGLMNGGERAVIAEDRVALVDPVTPFKRGEGWRHECAARDATAYLIATTPTIAAELIAARAKLEAAEKLAAAANKVHSRWLRLMTGRTWSMTAMQVDAEFLAALAAWEAAQ